jgi:DNA invertase Pin-like site-specific DNA recombinase
MPRRKEPAIVYVVARTGNGRPALQHVVSAVGNSDTLCGYDMSDWSRFYMATQLSILLCKKCLRISSVELASTRPQLRVVS